MAFDIEGARKEGHSDAEIADYLAQQQGFDVAGARSEGHGDADIISHLSQKQAAKLPQYDRQPGSVGARVARGLVEPFVGGAQLVMKGLGAVGAVSPEAVETQQDFTRGYVDKSTEMAPEGTDWARMVGNAVPLTAATLGTGGAGAGVGALARAGAVGGALGGAATPVTGDGFWGTKGLQTVAGGLGGAVLAPVGQKVLGALGQAGAYAVNRLRTLGRDVTPQNIEITITQALQQQGIDPANLRKVAPQYFAQVAKDVEKALKVGGNVDPTALANRSAFELVGAQGTAGQVGREGVQYGKEMFLRNAPGGEDLQANYQGTLQSLNARLADLQGKTAAPLRDYQAGQKVQGVMQASDAASKQGVTAAFNTARAAPGGDVMVDGREVAKAINDGLAAQRVSKALPGDYHGFLQEMGSGKGLSVGNIAEEIGRINALAKSYRGKPEEVALNIVKRGLMDAAEATPAGAGKDTADLFSAARKAARGRFQLHDTIPALKGTVDGDVAPDDFMKKFVYGATQDEFKKLRAYLRPKSREAWDQIKGQIVSDLRDAASKSGDPKDFSQAGFNKLFRSLEDDGKLDILFAPSELQMLKAIGRVGHLVQTPPPGVSTTGLGGAAKAMGSLASMASAFGKLGPAGKLASGAAQRGGNMIEAQASLRAPPVVTPPPIQVPQQGINYLATAFPPGFGVGAGNALALAFDASDPRGTMRLEQAPLRPAR